ncbi:putative ubiquitin conjugation factor E4-like [Hibiscus syriacus]|uniref:Ubiquitin conjugation factor E4-like n=1 Tax=Hibiscus syriacus TaxID=106335 RepID=A0A6A3A003_HIBSY|nr:putative ubiquitin conjugation factor E4-like [Hibiscus syriacus]
MSACNSLIRTYLSNLHCKLDLNPKPFSLPLSLRPLTSVKSSVFLEDILYLENILEDPISASRTRTRSFSALQEVAPLEDETPDDSAKDTVERLLTHQDDVSKMMKMERKSGMDIHSKLWFPYFDRFICGTESLSSREVIEAIEPALMEERKERLKRVVRNRSYSVCLVVEGLSDFGNVSATFRSADALGLQEMVGYRTLELSQGVFEVLKSRGYRIATHIGMDAVSIYDMDWSRPTAIVVGNENRGISDEALELSDLHCSIPMKGMVDSFNVSVAAGIVMHQAVCDRTMRLGCHGDLSDDESQILLAEFLLRHNNSSINIAHEYAKRKARIPPIARL